MDQLKHHLSRCPVYMFSHYEHFLAISLLRTVAIKENKQHVAGFEWGRGGEGATIQVLRIFVGG